MTTMRFRSRFRPAGSHGAGVHHDEEGHGEGHHGMLRKEGARQGKEGKEDQEKQGQVPGRGEEEEPDAPVQPGPGDGLGEGQNPENEEWRVFGEGLGNPVRLEDPEKVQRRTPRKGPSPPPARLPLPRKGPTPRSQPA